TSWTTASPSPTSSSTGCPSPWRPGTRGCTRSSRTGPRRGGLLLRPLDPLPSAHVGPQRFRDHHRAVLLLVVLDDGDERAAHGQAAAVQGVDEARLARGLRAVAEVGAAGLEVGAVG